MGKKRKLVEWQKVPKDPIKGRPFDSSKEYPNFNPTLAYQDGLPEVSAAPSTPQLIMGEGVEHLQGRQKEVYLLTMREGKSLSEAAEILGIEKASAQVYKNRAIKFLVKYCQSAMDRGRV